jgi:hypothetical protein
MSISLRGMKRRYALPERGLVGGRCRLTRISPAGRALKTAGDAEAGHAKVSKIADVESSKLRTREVFNVGPLLRAVMGAAVVIASISGFAWATNEDQCSKVFVKKGDKISFAQFSEEFGGGFVANGNDVRSKTVQCTIKSRKETSDTLDFQAACASEIMATSTNLRLKILDANTVSRIFTDPSLAGMELTFHRCSM